MIPLHCNLTIITLTATILLGNIHDVTSKNLTTCLMSLRAMCQGVPTTQISENDIPTIDCVRYVFENITESANHVITRPQSDRNQYFLYMFNQTITDRILDIDQWCPEHTFAVDICKVNIKNAFFGHSNVQAMFHYAYNYIKFKSWQEYAGHYPIGYFIDMKKSIYLKEGTQDIVRWCTDRYPKLPIGRPSLATIINKRGNLEIVGPSNVPTKKGKGKEAADYQPTSNSANIAVLIDSCRISIRKSFGECKTTIDCFGQAYFNLNQNSFLGDKLNDCGYLYFDYLGQYANVAQIEPLDSFCRRNAALLKKTVDECFGMMKKAFEPRKLATREIFNVAYYKINKSTWKPKYEIAATYFYEIAGRVKFNPDVLDPIGWCTKMYNQVKSNMDAKGEYSNNFDYFGMPSDEDANLLETATAMGSFMGSPMGMPSDDDADLLAAGIDLLEDNK